ncbi:MAG: DUF2851 family protein [Prevotella sp.]|nr:DUF2851 family protein [Prevotella sp.]
MERLLHYVWKHRLFPLKELTTTDGQTVEVVDTGLHNSNSGPDFFNAKVKIGGEMWVGNVEIHDHSKDWFRHGHDSDKAYDNVILHVVEEADDDVTTSAGRKIPQLQLPVPETVKKNYESLINEDRYPPCYKIIPTLSKIKVNSWLSALQTERLEQKTAAIVKRVEQSNGSWEEAFFRTLARNFGFGINGDAFEAWAQNLHIGFVAHHRDDIFQVEAFFMGQAGLLKPEAINSRYLERAIDDDYYRRLLSEYKYLSLKFNLTPMDPSMWRFMRLRPQNFPHIRVSQLAQLYNSGTANLSQILECRNMKELHRALATSVTEYWQTHFLFGAECRKSYKVLSTASKDLIIINTVVPMLFAYGRTFSKEYLCDRAFSLLEELAAEKNSIVTTWKECGLEAKTAADSQALIQLKKEYCDRKECLRCRFGYEYMSSNS